MKIQNVSINQTLREEIDSCNKSFIGQEESQNHNYWEQWGD